MKLTDMKHKLLTALNKKPYDDGFKLYGDFHARSQGKVHFDLIKGDVSFYITRYGVERIAKIDNICCSITSKL